MSSMSGSLEINGTLRGKLGSNSGMKGSLSAPGSMSGFLSFDTRDYRTLHNLPQINSVTLLGNKSLSELSLTPIYFDDSVGWAKRRDEISENGALYVYTDAGVVEKDGDTVYTAMIKMGDGITSIGDLPFLSDVIEKFDMIPITDREILDITEGW